MAVIAGSAPSLSRALAAIRQALAEGRDLAQVVIGEADVRVVPPAARPTSGLPPWPSSTRDSATCSRGWDATCRPSGPRSCAGQDARNDRLRDQFLPETWWNADLPARFEDHRPAILGQVAVGSLATDILSLHGVRPSAAIGYSMGESAALVALGAWTERDLMASRLMASPLFATELAGPCMAARRVWGLEPSEPVDWVAGIVSCDLADARGRDSRTVARLSPDPQLGRPKRWSAAIGPRCGPWWIRWAAHGSSCRWSARCTARSAEPSSRSTGPSTTCRPSVPAA